MYWHWRFEPSSVGAIPEVLAGRSVEVRDLAISPDREWVVRACGASGEISLVSVISKEANLIANHGGRATGVAFSEDGRWMASTGIDGRVLVWEFPLLVKAISSQGEYPAPTYEFDMKQVKSQHERKLAFHPRGMLYASSGDGDLFEWDLNESRPVAVVERLHSGGNALPDVQVSKDGRWLAVARHGWDREPREGSTQFGNLVLLFDVSEPGPPVRRAELRASFHHTTNLVFSEDGRWLAAGGAGDGVIVWDLEAADIAESLRTSPVSDRLMSGLAFSPDGQVLALGDRKGRLHLWNWQRDSAGIRTIATGRAIYTIGWLDSSRLVCGGEGGAGELWDTDTTRLKELARKIAGRNLTVEERKRFKVTR